MTTIYVGNLPFSATEEQLSSLFAAHGTVTRTKLMTDRDTGRSRGFAFVDMSDEDASRAMQELDGTLLDDCPLRVNEAGVRTAAETFPRSGGSVMGKT